MQILQSFLEAKLMKNQRKNALKNTCLFHLNLDSFWTHFWEDFGGSGAILGNSWPPFLHLGCFLGALGHELGALGHLLVILGRFLSHFVSILEDLGKVWGGLGQEFERVWSFWEALPQTLHMCLERSAPAEAASVLLLILQLLLLLLSI